jgi:hypothetical protein
MFATEYFCSCSAPDKHPITYNNVNMILYAIPLFSKEPLSFSFSNQNSKHIYFYSYAF